MFIASDANAAGLVDVAWKASRKPSRGGISNLICIGEPLEVLAAELGRIADRVTVILPWGNLLRTVAAPDPASLRQIANLCLPGASVEIVLSYDSRRDTADGRWPGLPSINLFHVNCVLPEFYQEAGLHMTLAARIPFPDLARYETTWSGRLAHGRSREVWRLLATRL